MAADELTPRSPAASEIHLGSQLTDASLHENSYPGESSELTEETDPHLDVAKASALFE